MNLEIKFDPEGHDNGVLDQLEKDYSLPTHLSKKKYLIQEFGLSGWDLCDHSFYKTEEYTKARAIIKSSAGKSVQQIRKKLQTVLPPYENIEQFLSWNYVFINEDGKYVNSSGAVSKFPRRWLSMSMLIVRPDGFIYRQTYPKEHVFISKRQLASKKGEEYLKEKETKKYKIDMKHYLDYVLRREKQLKKKQEELQ
jgi:hypothetical protein